MSNATHDIAPWLEPLDTASPSGPDLEYDPAFMALATSGDGKPERQWGDKLYAAEPPDWLNIQALAQTLAARTRDLRVAVWWLRSSARLQGLAGVASGLAFVHGLLSGMWASVHPQLDASDSDDPTMRLNALLPLAARGAFMADLRAAGLVPARGSLTLRDLELGLGLDEPALGEAVPTEVGVRQALKELASTHPQAADTLRSAHTLACQIQQVLKDRLGDADAPDLSRPIKLLAAADALMSPPSGAQAVASAAASASADKATTVVPISVAAPHGGGGIHTRDDVARQLGQIADWLERHEPSHPAPLLIRRAQRLMNMNFLDIIRDMAPGGLNEVEVVAGPPPPTESS